MYICINTYNICIGELKKSVWMQFAAVAWQWQLPGWRQLWICICMCIFTNNIYIYIYTLMICFLSLSANMIDRRCLASQEYFPSYSTKVACKSNAFCCYVVVVLQASICYANYVWRKNNFVVFLFSKYLLLNRWQIACDD